ncbi:hypothetical protein [Kitasatospora sp. A2-31]|uniref:hypothetical protein n=1 Tax=Kitasatospora sp. A2-31 TaxID=2916414 RepID=UPI001EEBB90F|nr:hypothetical protein [Kitasatospora sp. A2-31]MCG6494125.1 hypothetical protein [Kitasatospora sp. A2-31]
MASTPDLDRIADELYTLAPGDFTAARNDHADRLRKTDPQLAGEIRALRRPTLAAWAANLLAHHHRGLVEQLLALGQALRDAQEHLAGDRLRALTDQRRQVVRALAAQAREDAAEAGHPLGADAVTDLERTLGAALADPDAAQALARGRLTAPLEPVLWPGAVPGAPEGAGVEAPAGRTTGRRRTAAPAGTAKQSGARRREHSRARERAGLERARERALERARQDVADTELATREAADRRDAAGRALGAAESIRQRAQDEADRAQDDAARAQDEADRAQAALADAQERHARARAGLAEAQEQVRAARAESRTADSEAARAREAALHAVERLRDSEAGEHGGERS